MKKIIFTFLLFFSFITKAQNINFDLLSTDGRITEKDFPDKYLLISIGYTSCPDICPTTLYEIGNALKVINNRESLQTIFVTIDPVNDEINRLNSYTKYFDPSIIGLSGEMAEIENLTEQLGATFGYRLNGKKLEKPEFGKPYTVYHSTLIYLISPERELIDVFDYQIGAEDLAKALNEALPANNNPKNNEISKKEIADKESASRAPISENCKIPEAFKKYSENITFTVENPQNKIKLLNLWALWCAPCRKELPLLDEWNAKQDNFQIIALNLGDEEQAITKLFQELNIKNLAPESTKKALLQDFSAVGLPFSVLLYDKQAVASKSGIINDDDLNSVNEYAKCIKQNEN